jgi:hypothetical protein
MSAAPEAAQAGPERPGGVWCSGVDGKEENMASLSDGKWQRIRELVRKKTDVDCPTLKIDDIENAKGQVRVIYWCKQEDEGKDALQKQLILTNEEAESIGVNRTPRDHVSEMGG